MSRFLKRKKKVLAILVLLFLFTPFWYLSFIVWGLIVCYALNSRAKIVNYKALSILHNRLEITKINTLIIGDTCSPNITEKYEIGNTLAIQFPERSLEASIQILMHVVSVLEEHGRCIIVHDLANPRNKLTIFDLPFLHSITIKELQLEGLKRKSNYPLIHEPIISIKYALGLKKSRFRKTECPVEELSRFCKERKIDFVYLCRP